MDEHDSELLALVRTVRTRWRATTALRAWSYSAAGAALVLGLALSVHALSAPDGWALIALWLAAFAAALACAGWFLAPLRRVPGEHQVARYIEERCPELDDALVTAIVQGVASRLARRAGPQDPPPMTAAVAADAVRRTRGLDLDRIISRRAMRLASLRAAAATLVLFVLGAFASGPAGRAAGVLAWYVFPSHVALEVVPGDVKVREGAPLRILVRLPGGVAGIVPVLRTGEGTEWRDVRMEAARDGFAAAFDRVDQSFHYTVTAAGASSREYAVTVIRPPRVERIDLRYEYPPAFGMAPRHEEDGGDIYGPAGTRVHIVVHADKPVTQAGLALADGKRVALTTAGGALEGDLTILEDGSYRIALADGDGLSNPGETEYFIRTLEDRPPDVRIMRPATDREVTSIEEVPIEARAEDDFGVAALDLVYAVRGTAPKTVPLRREGSATSVTGTRTIYLEDLDVKPGDFVTYYARARDIGRGKRSTESRSDIFFLEVTPFEEEFVASQRQGAGGAGDQALDDMVKAEKDIITATWKLDTRARQARGRPDDDIRTVAKAQSDLLARATTMRGEMQRADNVRRVRPVGGRATAAAPPDPAPDAMSKAADAMERAEQQLDALSTTEALPHEMTALNELLRAQSETRRREVQQQQASGNGRGSNRQQQDLSSLFDRELARQQQTNYETPTSSETHEEKANEKDDAAADRIRELARRQDELNRQQEQAAKKPGVSGEDARRQLERLTREQTELRRQAEELAQQLQQAQGTPGQSGQGGRGGQTRPGGQASRELQQISEEMQGAASELRRDNPQQASERGARAAERLRHLEQRMRGAQPDDRRRAMGELQLSEELSRIRELREKLTTLDRQLAGLKNAAPGDGPRPQAGTEPGSQAGRGQRGGQGQNGESRQAWEDARALLDQLRGEKSKDIESPSAEGFNPGRSAPGTEAWKQDFSRWESLTTQIAASLERAEASAAARLRDQQAKDRLSAGATQAVPEQYRRLVDKYYEALASTPRERR